MDEQARDRVYEILQEIKAGTSPLTDQDFGDALTMGLFPLGIPGADSPFAQFLQEHCNEENGTRASVMKWDVMLSTLEERLKRKSADPSVNPKEG
jgi:hypothetical protein